jgi:hypothetical protein
MRMMFAGKHVECQREVSLRSAAPLAVAQVDRHWLNVRQALARHAPMLESRSSHEFVGAYVGQRVARVTLEIEVGRAGGRAGVDAGRTCDVPATAREVAYATRALRAQRQAR